MHRFINRLKNYNLIVLLSLILVGIVLYLPSFRGYFLSDDFIHVGYLYKVSQNPIMLLKNFYANWLDVPVTSFYRPFISVSLYLDYLLWGFRAEGYHLTNLIFHVANAFLIYFIGSRLVSEHKKLFGFFAAFLFISYPVHPEAVYWIIGRVDVFGTFFYLASLSSYILYREGSNKWFYRVSLLSLCIALGSKEIAVSLPVSIFLYEFFIVNEEQTFLDRVKKALYQSMWHLGLLIIYFLVRKLALGTFVGGYNAQSISGSFNILGKWEYPFIKLLFPYNAEYFRQFWYFSKLKYSFMVLWSMIALTIVMNYRDIVKREIGFLLCWGLVAIIPITPVMYLGTDLQGSRNLYLPSVVFVLLIMTLISKSLVRILPRIRFSVVVIVLLALSVCQSFTLMKNLVPWDEASLRLKALPSTFESIREATNGEEITIITNLTDNYYGAYFLRNGYNSFLSPPILKKTMNNIHFFGNKSAEGFGSTLKDFVMNNPDDKYNLYRYDFNSNQLHNVNVSNDESGMTLSPQFTVQGKELKEWSKSADISSSARNGDALIVVTDGPDPFLYKKDLDVNVVNKSVVKITMKIRSNERNGIGQLYWSSSTDSDFGEDRKVDFPVLADGKYHTYDVSVAAHMGWPAGGIIKDFRLDPWAGNDQATVEIKGLVFEDIKLNQEYLPVWDDPQASWRSEPDEPVSVTKRPKNLFKGQDIKLFSPKLRLNPWRSNYISVTMKAKAGSNLGRIYWTTEGDGTFDEIKKVEFQVIPDGKIHTYNIPVKNEITWWNNGDITQLRLDPVTGDAEVEIKKIELINGSKLTPKLDFAEKDITHQKFYKLGYVFNFKRLKQSDEEIQLVYDASFINGASKATLEISKVPFDNPNGYTFNSNLFEPRIELALRNDNYALDLTSLIKVRGLYYIRIGGLNNEGQPVGNFSDPVVVLIE